MSTPLVVELVELLTLLQLTKLMTAKLHLRCLSICDPLICRSIWPNAHPLQPQYVPRAPNYLKITSWMTFTSSVYSSHHSGPGSEADMGVSEYMLSCPTVSMGFTMTSTRDGLDEIYFSSL